MDGGTWWAAVHGVVKSQTRGDQTEATGFMVLEGWDFTVMDGGLSQVSRGRDGTSTDWIQVCGQTT